MTFKIQSGIDLPSRARGAGTSKYPVAQLEVGQSFFIPKASKAVGVTLSKLAKTAKITITTRKTTEFADYDAQGNGVGDKVEGLRVWRVADKAPAETAAA